MVRGIARTKKEAETTLTAAALEKNERFRPIVTNDFPSLFSINDFAWMGVFSWTLRDEKVKIIQDGVEIRLGGAVFTPMDAARIYLSQKYGRSPAATLHQVTNSSIHRSPPLFSLPGVYDDMVYADIKAAYWSILRLVGWDVDYNPGVHLGMSENMEDFPLPDNKLARNMLVSAALPGTVRCWNFGELIDVKIPNHLVNMPVWACVQDTLHAMALTAIKYGAVYVHTDGYILPRKNFEAFQYAGWEVGLNIGVKYSGDASIYGAGRYQIGKSPRLKEGQKTPSTVANLLSLDTEWLFKRLRVFKLQREYEGVNLVDKL